MGRHGGWKWTMGVIEPIIILKHIILEIILSRSYGYLTGTNNEILLQFFAISYYEVTMYFDSINPNVEAFSIMRRVSSKDGKLAK